MAEINLYDFQNESVESLRENIRRGVKNQILSAATGSGKTIIATHLLKEAHGKGAPSIFVADRINLIDQTSAVLDMYGVPHGVIQSNHWRFKPWEKIQVASAATLERRQWPEGTKLIIVDECHCIRKQVAKRIAKRDCVVIGLTATPFTKGLGKLYDAVVTVTTTNKLIDQGYLSNFKIFAASEPNMAGAKVVAGEWTDEAAAERAMPIIGDCVAEYLKHGQNKKFIAFGVNVAHCEEMQRQMLAAGIQCALYTYQTGDDARTEMVQEFRKPDSYIRGLISVAALSKGFDVPDVEVIIMARPLRSSLAEHIQIMGRGLRAFQGKTHCLILDHAGNCVRFWNAMVDFFENGASTLDDGKHRERQVVQKKERKPVKCPKCSAVHNPRPSCPNCGYQYPRISGVETEAGELIAVSGGAVVSREDKQAIWSQLLFVARERNYKEGWASWKYKEKTGVWPRGLQDIPIEPSPGLLNWLRSRQIAYAKRKM
jgi:superfamily II DNA or RNA helicase